MPDFDDLIYDFRTMAERVNARLKDEFGADFSASAARSRSNAISCSASSRSPSIRSSGWSTTGQHLPDPAGFTLARRRKIHLLRVFCKKLSRLAVAQFGEGRRARDDPAGIRPAATGLWAQALGRQGRTNLSFRVRTLRVGAAEPVGRYPPPRSAIGAKTGNSGGSPAPPVKSAALGNSDHPKNAALAIIAQGRTWREIAARSQGNRLKIRVTNGRRAEFVVIL